MKTLSLELLVKKYFPLIHYLPKRSPGVFTFMLAAVTRIFWFMLQEEKREPATTVDSLFQRRWMANIAEVANKIVHTQLYIYIPACIILGIYTKYTVI